MLSWLSCIQRNNYKIFLNENVSLLYITAECYDCTEGKYCEFAGMTEPTGPCGPGFFCTGRSNTSTPNDGVTGDICPQGQYCPLGSHIGKCVQKLLICIKEETIYQKPGFTGWVLQGADGSVGNCQTSSRRFRTFRSKWLM